MTDTGDSNPEASALRGKRAPRRIATAPAPGGTALTSQPPAPEPDSVYEYMNTRSFILLDPREKAPVIEIGGHVPEADLQDKYVRSEFDATETLIPAGCTTGVSRILWQQGQHVRRDIYERYVRMYRSDADQ